MRAHAERFEKSTWFYILTMSKIQSGTECSWKLMGGRTVKISHV